MMQNIGFEHDPRSRKVTRYFLWLQLAAVISVIGFFAFGLSSYVVHGILRDTDNQFARPHKLGRAELPPAMMFASMVLLIAGELGGFAVLFWGAITS